MTHHAESEAEAFFRRGEEGTYAGGPAESLPVGMLDVPGEDPTPPPTPEQLERRARFKRLVAAIVTTLGAGAVLAILVRLGGNAARPTESEVARAPAPAVVTKSEISSPAERVPATQAEPLATTTSLPAVAQKEEPRVEPTTAPNVGSVPADGPAAESRDRAPARTAIVPAAGPSAGNIRVSPKPPRSVIPAPKSGSPKPLDAIAPASMHAAPPTVSFPD
jgi:hypothetical protein